MKKVSSLFLLIFLLLSTSAQATLTPVLSFSSNATNLSANQFLSLNTAVAGSTVESNRYFVAADAMTFNNLNVTLPTAPNNGAGTQSVISTLFVNGSATALTCTISETSTTCADTTNSVNVARGQTVSVKETFSGTPTGSPALGYVLYNSLNGDNQKSLLGGVGGATNLSAAAVNYVTPFFKAPTATESEAQFVMPAAGVLQKMYVLLSGAPANGAGTQSYTFTVDLGGVAQTTTCTISEAQTTCEDAINNVPVVAGSLVSISVTPSGTPTARLHTVGMVFASSKPGLSIFSANSSSTGFSASVTNYLSVNIGANPTATIGNQPSQFPPSLYIRNYTVHLFTAPANGAGTQSHTFSFRDQTAGADTAATCSISEASTDCSYSNNVGLAASIFSGMHEGIPAGTPVAGMGTLGIAYTFIAPSDAIVNNAVVNNAIIRGF